MPTKKLRKPTLEEVQARLKELAGAKSPRNQQPPSKEGSGRWWDEADVKDFDSIIRSVR